MTATETKQATELENGPVSELAMPIQMDISEAPGLKTALQIEAASGCNVLLDASEVERLSAACAQVLIAFSREVAAQGRAARVVNASPAFLAGIETMGLSNMIEIEDAAQ